MSNFTKMPNNHQQPATNPSTIQVNNKPIHKYSTTTLLLLTATIIIVVVVTIITAKTQSTLPSQNLSFFLFFPWQFPIAHLLVGIILGLIVPTILPLLSRTDISFVATKTIPSRSARTEQTDCLLPTSSPLSGSYFVSSNLHFFIHYREWKPSNNNNNKSPTAIVFIVHGVGEHIGRYDAMAQKLCNELQVHVVGIDHRGHGRSEGERLFIQQFDDYVNDCAHFSNLIRQRDPKLPQIVLGHSMGGLITIRLLERFPEMFEKAIISAPALTLDATRMEQIFVRIASKLVPKMKTTAVDVNFLCHDSVVVSSLQNIYIIIIIHSIYTTEQKL
jgi:alpha/beta superfamily hydrolase